MSGANESQPGVCVVTHPLSSSGENATRTLLNILSAVTTVSLVTADLPKDSTIRENHTVVEVTDASAGQASVLTAAYRFLRNQFRMAHAIAQRHEDIVLFFGASSYVIPVVCAKLLGKTVAIEPRGDVPLTLKLNWEKRYPVTVASALSGVVSSLETFCYRLADGVITYTPSMAEELELDNYSHKLYPWGARYVDVDEFDVQQPYDDRELIVGFIGRLDEEKNVRTLLRVAELLPDHIKFRFIGDGPLRSELERCADSERISFTGWVDHDDVPSELNKLRLLILPSSPTEGLPTTILESLACGTPVFATPVSGVPDVVQHRKTGFLIRSMEPAEIADDISSIISRKDITTVSSQGRELVETEYDFCGAVDRYRTILDELG